MATTQQTHRIHPWFEPQPENNMRFSEVRISLQQKAMHGDHPEIGSYDCETKELTVNSVAKKLHD